jgi:hypothetical protein
MAAYAWVITDSFIDDVPDDVEYGTNEARTGVDVTGPHDATDEQVVTARNEGVPFKMYDDDGIKYFEGRFWAADGAGADSEYAFGPLDDYGMPDSGCTEIRYPTGPNGRYETL